MLRPVLLLLLRLLGVGLQLQLLLQHAGLVQRCRNQLLLLLLLHSCRNHRLVVLLLLRAVNNLGIEALLLVVQLLRWHNKTALRCDWPHHTRPLEQLMHLHLLLLLLLSMLLWLCLWLCRPIHALKLHAAVERSTLCQHHRLLQAGKAIRALDQHHCKAMRGCLFGLQGIVLQA